MQDSLTFCGKKMKENAKYGGNHDRALKRGYVLDDG